MIESQLLSKILNVLTEIRDLQKKHLPEGETETYTINLSSSKPTENIIPPVSPWYSVLVLNNGPGDVVVSSFYGSSVLLTPNDGNNQYKISPGDKSIRGLTIGLNDINSSATVLVICLR